MSTQYLTSFVTALLLSMSFAQSTLAAEPGFQLGNGMSAIGQGSAGLGTGIPGLQAHLSGTTGLFQQPGGVSLSSFSSQWGQGTTVLPGALSNGGASRPADSAQAPTTETEHTTLILAALLMVGMVVSRRLMR